MTALLNRVLFSKLIALAESDQDGEALSSIRKAAALARGAGMSLPQAMGVTISVKPDRADDLAKTMLQARLDEANLRILELERDQSQAAAKIEAAFGQGYSRGHKAGLAVGRKEAHDPATNDPSANSGHIPQPRFRTNAETHASIKEVFDNDGNLTDREIARRVGCSPSTVGNHRRRFFRMAWMPRTVTRGGQIYKMRMSDLWP